MINAPEQIGLGAWTELCEMCDWDESAALQVIERFVQVKTPYPTGRARELCQSLSLSYAAIKAAVFHDQFPEA